MRAAATAAEQTEEAHATVVLQHEAPKLEIEQATADYARVTAEPLARGFAHTLGNAIRRVMLSAIRGAAVTSVRIDQVQHEFSTIPAMKEDTTEFLLNLRGIRLRALADRPAEMTLNVSGQRAVTAADIDVPHDYEIVNTDLYLATLDAPEAELSVRMNIQTGYGFRPSERSANGESPIGLIPLDAVFTPVRRVSYEVHPARGGKGDGHEQLMLEVWTDGSIDGKDAIKAAAQLLQDELVIFATLGDPHAPRQIEPNERLGISVEEYHRSIDELQLSVRAHNCLKRSGLMVVGQILEKSEDELLTLRNFGEKSYIELVERLHEMDIIDEHDSRLRRAREGVFSPTDEEPLTELPPVPEDAEVESERIVSEAPPDDEEEPPSPLGAALLEALRKADAQQGE